MSICGDFGRVFEIGPVSRAEDSFTHRHLCEFTGLDVDMEIKKHYFEVMDIVDILFVTIFDGLNQNCKKELEAVGNQYPFEPLKYLRKTLRLTYEEGIQMLKEAGVEIEPFGDLNTKAEKKLGQLVLEMYGTEFYILHRYPLKVRPFYTMPCYDNPDYSNSFDVFKRDNYQISGSSQFSSDNGFFYKAEIKSLYEICSLTQETQCCTVAKIENVLAKNGCKIEILHEKKNWARFSYMLKYILDGSILFQF